MSYRLITSCLCFYPSYLLPNQQQIAKQLATRHVRALRRRHAAETGALSAADSHSGSNTGSASASEGEDISFHRGRKIHSRPFGPQVAGVKSSFPISAPPPPFNACITGGMMTADSAEFVARFSGALLEGDASKGSPALAAQFAALSGVEHVGDENAFHGGLGPCLMNHIAIDPALAMQRCIFAAMRTGLRAATPLTRAYEVIELLSYTPALPPWRHERGMRGHDDDSSAQLGGSLAGDNESTASIDVGVARGRHRPTACAAAPVPVSVHAAAAAHAAPRMHTGASDSTKSQRLLTELLELDSLEDDTSRLMDDASYFGGKAAVWPPVTAAGAADTSPPIFSPSLWQRAILSPCDEPPRPWPGCAKPPLIVQRCHPV